ncbi:Rid family hydrolase [Sinorhizobium meliloti]|uniref:Rid family hydrolase n=1 Tax=Rhizobium meliloti TaxID=382 RepID=UPI00299D793A
MIKPVPTSDALGAVGPFSQAIKVGDLLFVSGNSRRSGDGKFNLVNAVDQADQSLKNLEAIAKPAGTELLKRVKTTVLLTADYAEVNRIYAASSPRPSLPPPAIKSRHCPKVRRWKSRRSSPRSASDEHRHQRNAPEQWRVIAPD